MTNVKILKPCIAVDYNFIRISLTRPNIPVTFDLAEQRCRISITRILGHVLDGLLGNSSFVFKLQIRGNREGGKKYYSFPAQGATRRAIRALLDANSTAVA